MNEIRYAVNFLLGMIYASNLWTIVILIDGENTSPWIIFFSVLAIIGTILILGTAISWLTKHWDDK